MSNIGVRFYLTMTRARHVPFSKIGGQFTSLDYQLRVNTRIAPGPPDFHLLNAVSVEVPLEFD